MDSAEIEWVASDLDALAAEVEGARHRHVSGLDAEPALSTLFARRPDAAHRRTAAALREAGNDALAGRVAAMRAERAQAEDEEAWRAAEARASGFGPEGPLSLAAAEAATRREPDRERRAAFGRAAAEAGEAAAARREAAAETRARARSEVGLAPDWKLVVEGDEVLRSSDDAWADVLAFAARRELGIAPRPRGDLARADLVHLFALRRWDGLFRPGMLAVALKLAWEKLALDPGRIRVDDADRSAKWWGVHVHGGSVSFRARGGAGDWQDLFEGTARALANAAQPASRREPAFSHAFGAALASLLLERRFLAERADVERRHADDVVRDLALRALFALRARAAGLRVATEVERGTSGAAWREAYREAMTSALGAAWDATWASRDADAEALAAALAGAGQGERLRRELRERFDEDWWRNPRTGQHLAALLASGRLPGGDDPAPPRLAAEALVARMQ